MSKRHFDFSSSSDAPAGPSSPGAYPTPPARKKRRATTPPPTSDCSLYSSYSSYSARSSAPSDSPTNPFGFVRRHGPLGLPKETSFSRHLALRLQLVSAPDLPPLRPRPRKPPRLDARGDPAWWEHEGAYRIAQVPLNYSLAHLRALILFLFAGSPALAHAPPPPGEPGYLFEAKRDVGHDARRPGALSGGTTWAKASRAQDPYYKAAALGFDGELDAGDELPFFEEDEDWAWENEDEFGLANVWPPGGDVSRAIVYRHDSARVVHVTVSTQTIPARKGVGNRPFVFRAYHDLALDPRPTSPSTIFPRTPDPTPPQPATAVKKPPPPAPARRTNPFARPSIFPKPNTKFTTLKPALPSPSPSPTHEEKEEDPDAFDGGLDPARWNRHDAFARFLAKFAGRAPGSPGAAHAHALPNTLPDDSPARLPGGSSSASSLGQLSSPSSTYSFRSSQSVRSSSPAYVPEPAPLRLPLITPTHAHAPTRARQERAERRIRAHTAAVEQAAGDEEARRAAREERRAKGERERALQRLREGRERKRGREAERVVEVVDVAHGLKTPFALGVDRGREEEVRGGDGWGAIPAGAGEMMDEDEEEDEDEKVDEGGDEEDEVEEVEYDEGSDAVYVDAAGYEEEADI